MFVGCSGVVTGTQFCGPQSKPIVDPNFWPFNVFNSIAFANMTGFTTSSTTTIIPNVTTAGVSTTTANPGVTTTGIVVPSSTTLYTGKRGSGWRCEDGNERQGDAIGTGTSSTIRTTTTTVTTTSTTSEAQEWTRIADHPCVCCSNIDDNINNNEHHCCATADRGSEWDHQAVRTADRDRRYTIDSGCRDPHIDWIRYLHGEDHGESLKSSVAASPNGWRQAWFSRKCLSFLRGLNWVYTEKKIFSLLAILNSWCRWSSGARLKRLWQCCILSEPVRSVLDMVWLSTVFYFLSTSIFCVIVDSVGLHCFFWLVSSNQQRDKRLHDVLCNNIRLMVCINKAWSPMFFWIYLGSFGSTAMCVFVITIFSFSTRKKVASIFQDQVLRADRSMHLSCPSVLTRNEREDAKIYI